MNSDPGVVHAPRQPGQGHLTEAEVDYQAGWDDGYALRPVHSLLLLNFDYFDGYLEGLDEAEREGR